MPHSTFLPKVASAELDHIFTLTCGERSRTSRVEGPHSTPARPGRAGFTLIELVLTLGLIIIIIGISVAIINPGKQLAKARNSERSAEVNTIMLALGRLLASQQGNFSCSSGPLPTSTRIIASSGTSTYNLGPCLVPGFVNALPYDPSASGTHYTSVSNYNTGYAILTNTTSGQITISAPSAELGQTISVTR